jgi:hypothetical protein
MAAPIGRFDVRAGDRRLNQRFPIGMALEYKLLQYDSVVGVGEGRTLNMSSSGALIKCEAAVPRGFQIELSFAWPAKTEGTAGLTLVAIGTAFRSTGQTVAVAFSRYYFKTTTRPTAESSAVPGSENCVRTIASPATLSAAGE